MDPRIARSPLTWFAACALAAHSAAAQPVAVLVANSNLLTTVPGSPPGTTSYTGAALSDDGASVRVNISTGTSTDPWLYRSGSFARYALVDSAGAFGPNRQGAEAGHVFLTLTATRDLGAGPIAFVGQAAPSGTSPTGVPFAVWRNPGGQNVEIMRLGVDTALGPNLGSNWRFGSTGTNNLNLNQTSAGGVLIDTQVLTPTNTARHAVVLHTPGVGNAPCMVQGETGALGPNTPNPAAFFIGSFTGYFPAVSPDNRVYVNATVEGTGFQEGIWRVCDGAPTPIALQNITGALGPGTSLTGRFNQVRSNARPWGASALVFAAEYRFDDAAFLAHGFFRHAGGANLLTVAEAVTGALGPNYQSAVFVDLSPAFTPFATAGNYLVFETDIRKTDNTVRRGLWRMPNGGVAEPIAIENEPGAVAPPVGMFQRIDRWTVFGNGDVIAEMAVTGGPGGLYRFVRGRAPEIIFGVGQSVLVPTPQGLRTATVSSFALANDELGSQSTSSHWAGYDAWAGRNGAILISANINLDGNPITALLLLQASDQELLLRDGFES
jgi:hypothetical protein